MSFSIHIIHRAALISDSSALSQTPVELQDHGNGAWCACLPPEYAGAKLYCFVTKAHVCECFAQVALEGGWALNPRSLIANQTP